MSAHAGCNKKKKEILISWQPAQSHGLSSVLSHIQLFPGAFGIEEEVLLLKHQVFQHHTRDWHQTEARHDTRVGCFVFAVATSFPLSLEEASDKMFIFCKGK